MKNYGEKKRGRIQGLTKFFGYPLLSQEREKATDFKFGQCIQRVHANKSPLKILEKSQHSRIQGVQGLPNFFGYPLLSQERVKLRNSNFACIFIGSIATKAH